ncbi:hypothetical protein BU14_0071s0001 [Porphyra umbilicalis]|uniref:Phospholipid/glycerol acyltransferase domain-containing protein n=1 Tax=Porphyra umbilicalis TaxID=2786 RepID=A0A1X6PG72_PORUM|nr:hypothetical protein BU14_0071s0001 [Porphyra umbilicalis]|eukprot:OSX79746.1 hypothetical protein BU14_0071s0001 [Porphyra umbilicalis]
MAFAATPASVRRPASVAAAVDAGGGRRPLPARRRHRRAAAASAAPRPATRPRVPPTAAATAAGAVGVVEPTAVGAAVVAPNPCFDIVWAAPPALPPAADGTGDGGGGNGSGDAPPPPPPPPLGAAQLDGGALTAAYTVASLTHRPSDTTSSWEQLTDSAVAALATVLARTRADRVTLVGESFGALVALRVAAAAPTGTIDTLTLLNSATAVAQPSLPAVTVRALTPLLPLLKADLVGGRLFYTAAAAVMWALLTDRTRLARGGASPGAGAGEPWEPPRGLDVRRAPLAATLHRTRLIRQFVAARWAADAALLDATAGVRGGVGLIASGRDRLLPSVAEADRLARVWKGGGVPVWRTVLPDSAHACLLEAGVRLVDLLAVHDTPAGGADAGAARARRDAPAEHHRGRGGDGGGRAAAAAAAAGSSRGEPQIPPPPAAYARMALVQRVLTPLRVATSPVFLHSSRVRDAAVAARVGGGRRASAGGGSPPRPLLFVGNHTSLGILDLPLLVTHLVATHGLALRSLAHPVHFDQFSAALPGWGALLTDLGAIPASPRNYVRLLASGQPTLLFPGGAREVATRSTDGKYELQWAEGSFVRAAARYGALIIPVASVGVEDATAIVADGPQMQAAPLVGNAVRAAVAAAGFDGADLMPLVAPTGGGERFYFSFGAPIDAAAFDGDADELFAAVKGGVEAEIRAALAYRDRDDGRYLRGRVLGGGGGPVNRALDKISFL